MNWFQKLKGNVYGWLAANIFQTNLYLWWSQVQRLREKEFKDIDVPLVADQNELVREHTSNFVWEADGPRRLWDTVSYVGRIIKTKKDDCDGWAQFIALTVDKSIRKGVWTDKTQVGAGMLAVVYQKADGKLGGHMVALHHHETETERHIFSWQDYGFPNDTNPYVPDGVFRKIEHVARNVARDYAGSDGRLLAFGVYDSSLRPIAGVRVK